MRCLLGQLETCPDLTRQLKLVRRHAQKHGVSQGMAEHGLGAMLELLDQNDDPPVAVLAYQNARHFMLEAQRGEAKLGMTRLIKWRHQLNGLGERLRPCPSGSPSDLSSRANATAGRLAPIPYVARAASTNATRPSGLHCRPPGRAEGVVLWF